MLRSGGVNPDPNKKGFGLLGVFLVLAGLCLVGWDLQPWMPEGRAVHLVDAHFDDYDFQVWQRKNGLADLTAPFATALFVRKAGRPWKAYQVGIQDTYRPLVALRKESSGVTIFYGKTRRAYFEEEKNVFTLHHWNGGSNVIEGTAIDSTPPGDWGQRLDSHR